jgi:ankyrin repeat protein
VTTIFVDLLNNRWESPLIAAVQTGAVDSVTALINCGARVNQQDRRDNTALHYAVINSNMKIFNALLAANADCNVRNAEGKSPFHLLADSGHATMANQIVGKRDTIDLDIPDHEENGPFMYALKRGCTRMVRYFLAIGSFVKTESLRCTWRWHIPTLVYFGPLQEMFQLMKKQRRSQPFGCGNLEQ